MSDDPRVYSDEEFALILRKATEMASRAEPSGGSATGLTLTEMQSAAAQVGLDPALVERAARMVRATAAASPLERLIGGPLQHDHEVRFPIRLDEDGAARLLSVMRISAGVAGGRDVGHSGAVGMTWHDGGELEALGVTARVEEDGTAVSVVVDRRATLGVVVGVSSMTLLFALLFAVFALYPEAPALGYAGAVAGTGGVLAIARGYWAASTRKVRERLDVVIDAIGRTLTGPETEASRLLTGGDGTPAGAPAAIAVAHEQRGQ